jgi:hypothetical protein
MAAVMFFASATESNASPARVAGLNLMGPSTGFVRDYVNVYPYPVAINRYPNMMWANLGHQSSGFEAAHRVMGMYHEIGEDGMHGILGVTLREDSPVDPLLSYLGYYGASHQQFDLMYGRDMEKASFALRFDMARSSFEDEDGNTRAPDESVIGIGGHVNTWGIGAGVDVDINEDAMLEIGAEVRQYTFEDEATGLKDDGSISFAANARVFYERTENKTMIPLVSFNFTKIGEENGETVTDEWMDFFGGVACNQVVNGDDLLIYGAAFRFQSMKTENSVTEVDESSRSIPVLFMAVEHKFRDWLVGRGGASQAMAWDKDNAEDNEQTEMFSDFSFALGIALEFSNFTIDATLNQNYPFTGFWFVSGEPTNDLFGEISFTYTYD